MLELTLSIPNYFFIPLDNELLKVYNEGFSLGDIFKVKGRSIITNADELLINTKLDKLKNNIDEYMRGESNIEVGELTKSKGVDLNGTYKILPYRVFDNRHYYHSRIVSGPCPNLIKHESIENNYFLSFLPISVSNEKFSDIIITKTVPESKILKGKDRVHSAPLYIYNEQNKIESNIKESFIKEINNCVGDTENILNI